MDVIPYLRLIRFRYHITFLVVIAGAMALATRPFYELVVPLLIMYLAFNVLMYGGLYTLNDVADLTSDAGHPAKKNRPLPSGAVSVANAYVFALVIISAGLLTAYCYFGAPVFLLFLLFIAVNLSYTRLAKRVPYIEILFNSLTYPMRFLLGALLAGALVPDSLLLAVFLLAFGVASVRRVIEKRMPGSQARKVLKYYTEQNLLALQILCFIALMAVCAMNFGLYIPWYIAIILLYVISVFGIYVSKRIVNFYQRVF